MKKNILEETRRMIYLSQYQYGKTRQNIIENFIKEEDDDEDIFANIPDFEDGDESENNFGKTSSDDEKKEIDRNHSPQVENLPKKTQDNKDIPFQIKLAYLSKNLPSYKDSLVNLYELSTEYKPDTKGAKSNPETGTLVDKKITSKMPKWEREMFDRDITRGMVVVPAKDGTYDVEELSADELEIYNPWLSGRLSDKSLNIIPYNSKTGEITPKGRLVMNFLGRAIAKEPNSPEESMLFNTYLMPAFIENAKSIIYSFYSRAIKNLLVRKHNIPNTEENNVAIEKILNLLVNKIIPKHYTKETEGEKENLGSFILTAADNLFKNFLKTGRVGSKEDEEGIGRVTSYEKDGEGKRARVNPYYGPFDRTDPGPAVAPSATFQPDFDEFMLSASKLPSNVAPSIKSIIEKNVLNSVLTDSEVYKRNSKLAKAAFKNKKTRDLIINYLYGLLGYTGVKATDYTNEFNDETLEQFRYFSEENKNKSDEELENELKQRNLWITGSPKSLRKALQQTLINNENTLDKIKSIIKTGDVEPTHTEKRLFEQKLIKMKKQFKELIKEHFKSILKEIEFVKELDTVSDVLEGNYRTPKLTYDKAYISQNQSELTELLNELAISYKTASETEKNNIIGYIISVLLSKGTSSMFIRRILRGAGFSPETTTNQDSMIFDMALSSVMGRESLQKNPEKEESLGDRGAVVKALEYYKPGKGANFLSFLSTIASQLFVDNMKREREKYKIDKSLDAPIGNSDDGSTTTGAQMLPSDDSEKEDEEFNQSTNKILKNAISQLKDMEQKIVKLLYFQQMSGEEVANFLNIDPRYVRQINFRAKKKLKDILSDYMTGNKVAKMDLSENQDELELQQALDFVEQM